MATKVTQVQFRSKGGPEVGDEFDKVGKKGEDALRRIRASAQPVGPALKVVDQAAQGVHQRLEAMAGPLAALGKAGIAAAGIGALAAGIAVLTKRAIEHADALEEQAKATGLSIKSYQEYKFAADQAGVGAAQFASLTRAFTKNLGEAAAGTGTLVAKLKETDPAFLKAIQNAQSTDEALTLVMDRLAGTARESDRAALAVAAFGKQGVAIAPVAKEIETLRQQARDLGLVLDENLVRQGAEASDALAALGQTLEANVQRVFLALAPAIKAAADEVARFVAFMGKALEFQFTGGVTIPLEGKVGELTQKLATLERELELAGRPIARGQGPAPRDPALVRQDIEATLAARNALVVESQEAARNAEAREAAARRAAVAEAEGARASAGATKERASAHKQFVEESKRLEEELATAGLDGVARIRAEEQLRFKEVDEALKAGVASEQDAADRKVTIHAIAEREIAELQTKEAEKAAEKSAREAERAMEKAAREAERQAERMARPIVNALRNVQEEFGDFWTQLYEDGTLTFDSIADFARTTFARLAGELTSLAITESIAKPLFAQLVGSGSLTSALGITPGTSAGIAPGQSVTTGGLFNTGSLINTGAGLFSRIPGFFGGSAAPAVINPATGGVSIGGTAAVQGPATSAGVSLGTIVAAVGALYSIANSIKGLVETNEGFRQSTLGDKRAAQSFTALNAVSTAAFIAGGAAAGAAAGAPVFGVGAIPGALIGAAAGAAIAQAINQGVATGVAKGITGALGPGPNQAQFERDILTTTEIRAIRAGLSSTPIAAARGQRAGVFEGVIGGLLNPLGALIDQLILGSIPSIDTIFRKLFVKYVDAASGVQLNRQLTGARAFPGLRDEASVIATIAAGQLGAGGQRVGEFSSILRGSLKQQGQTPAEAEQTLLRIFRGIAGESFSQGLRLIQQFGPFRAGRPVDAQSARFDKFLDTATKAFQQQVPLVDLRAIGTRLIDDKLLTPGKANIQARQIAREAFPAFFTGATPAEGRAAFGQQVLGRVGQLVDDAFSRAILKGPIGDILTATTSRFTRETRRFRRRTRRRGVTPAETSIFEQRIAAAAAKFGEDLEATGPQIEEYIRLQEKLNDAMEAAVIAVSGAEIRAKIDKDVGREILQFEDPFAAARDALEEERKARIEEAEKVGADVLQIEKLYGLKRRQLAEQEAAARAAVTAPVTDVIAGLTETTAAGAAPQTALAAAAERWAKARNAMEAALGDGLTQDDADEYAEVAAAAQVYLSAAREVYASGPEYANRYNAVVGYLKGLPHFAEGGSFTVPGMGGTDSQVVPLVATPGERVSVSRPSDVAALQRVPELLTALGTVTGSGLARLVEEVRALRAANAAMASELQQVRQKLERDAHRPRSAA